MSSAKASSSAKNSSGAKVGGVILSKNGSVAPASSSSSGGGGPPQTLGGSKAAHRVWRQPSGSTFPNTNTNTSASPSVSPPAFSSNAGNNTNNNNNNNASSGAASSSNQTPPLASPTTGNTSTGTSEPLSSITSTSAAPERAAPQMSTAMQLRLAAAAAGGANGRPVMIMGPNGVPIRVRPFPGGALTAQQQLQLNNGVLQQHHLQLGGGQQAGGQQFASANNAMKRSVGLPLGGGRGSPIPVGSGTTNSTSLFSPHTARVLVFVRNMALFFTAIILLHMVASNHGPLPTIIVAVLMHKGGMFAIIRSGYVSLQRSLRGDDAEYEMMLRRADSMRAPVTKKEGSISQKAKSISYGFSSMQGWRRSMEDAHTMILDGTRHEPHLHTPPPPWRIPSNPSLGPIHNQGLPQGKGGFFAVFDGHCGPRVAHYCSEHLYHFVCKSPAWSQRNYKQALTDGFVAMDMHLYQHMPEERSGCTAVAILISEDGKTLYCANAGDSRAIIGQQSLSDGSSNTLPVGAVSAPDGALGIGNGFESVSEDHKPYNKNEQIRIEKAGSVVVNKRVNGILALSRAIGDFSFKRNRSVPWSEQAVTCVPDVKELAIDLARDQFIVIACDGIWDVKTNEFVANFVRTRLRKKVALHTICEQLMHVCLSSRPFGNGCDNMSVIIVTLDDSVFMQSVGGAVTGGNAATPAVRPNVSPPALIGPSSTTASPVKDTSAKSKTAQASVGSLEESSEDTSQQQRPTPLVGSEPASPTKAKHGITDEEDDKQSEKERDEDKESEELEEEEIVASPSLVRPDQLSFPSSFPEDVPESFESECSSHGPLEDDDQDGIAANPEDETEQGTFEEVKPSKEDEERDDEDEVGEEGQHYNDNNENDNDNDEDEDDRISEALEAAKVFSPKTPQALRESQTWDSARCALEHTGAE